MGTTSEKLTYLNTTKGKIKDSINLTGANITTEPFRQYSTKLEDAYIDILNNGTDTLYNNFPKVSGEGTSITLNNTYQAPMRNLLKGNTSQTGTPTPTSPIPVNVVSGDNTITISNQSGTDSNTYNIDLPSGMELCKIGNYQDYFYKDSDKWYLHKEIGKKVFNGSELWYADGQDGKKRKRVDNILDGLGVDTYTIANILSNLYVPTTATNTYLGNMGIALSSNGKTILIYDENYNTSDATSFKQMLANNNLVLYYALATPTNTEITDITLINQLEELYIAKSKENQTNISQINNDLPFIISASALKKG